MNVISPILIGALIGGIGGALPGFGIAWLMLRRRRRIYRSLRERIPSSVAPEEICDVRYTSARRLRSPWKFLPWQMIGVLFADGEGLTAYMQTANGKRSQTLRFNPQHHMVDWRGTESFMRNGLLNWLAIGSPRSPEHFFTAETGVTIFGSKAKTQNIVRMLQASLHMKRCLQCGYELWGNTTGVCPECGAQFTKPEVAVSPPIDDAISAP